MKDGRESELIAVLLPGKETLRPLFPLRVEAQELPFTGPRSFPEGAILKGSLSPSGTEAMGSWELLAEPSSARWRLYDLMARRDIDPLYPAEALDEVASFARNSGIDDPSLTDLTEIPFVTIDNPDSKDLDQALHIERFGENGFRLRYALADASHFAPPRSALFEEALRRGVTIYLPGMNVPMLPPLLSEGLVSLNPDVERRAVVMTLDVNAKGLCTQRRLEKARILSRAKLSYPGVQRFHDDPQSSPLNGRDFTESLLLLAQLGKLRQNEARQRHVVRYDRLEQRVVIADEAFGRFALTEEKRCAVDGWNEQVSLLCNLEGAALLAEGMEKDPHIQAIFRIHEGPDPRSLSHLQRMLKAMAQAHGLDRKLWEWDGRSPLADFLEALPRDSKHAPLRAAAQRQILLSNRRASFSPEPGRHYGLAIEPYVRFTAPMREVVGIFTHKEALEHVGLLPPCLDSEDEIRRNRIIEAAHKGQARQKQVEKDLLHWAVDAFLRHDMKEELAIRPYHGGILLGMKDKRAYVRIQNPPVDLALHLQHLEEMAGESISVSEDGATLLRGEHGRPWLRMGDNVDLVTVGREKGRGKWLLAPIEIARP